MNLQNLKSLLMSCHIYILSNVKLSKLEKEPLSAKKNYSQIGSGEEVLDKSFAKLPTMKGK